MAAVLFTTACSDYDYVLVGATPQWSNDDTVLIKPFDSNEIIAKVKLEDHKFTYQGKIDKTDVIVVCPPDETVVWTVLLEPGTMFLDAYSSEVTGTPLNDDFCEFSKEVTNIYYKYGADEYDSLAKEKAESFINDHLDDSAGAMALITSTSLFDTEKIKDFLQKSGPSFYSSAFTKALVKNYPRLKEYIPSDK